MDSSFEAAHVHTVYNEIALDFSRTRHSRWPFVQRFLDQLPAGSTVLDAGTGNGKYLGCRSVLNWQGKEEEGIPQRHKGKGKAVEREQVEEAVVPRGEILPIGFDMSEGLLGVAGGRGHEVVRGDCVDLSCWRRGAFNHCISIATIHHFATPSRRTESIKQMILCVLPPSPRFPSSSVPAEEAQILIVVWSLEQDPSFLGARSARRTTGGKKGAIPVSSLGEKPVEAVDDGEEAEEQDVFVPWEKQEPQVKKVKPERVKKGGQREPQNGANPAPTSESSSTLVDSAASLSISDTPSSNPPAAADPQLPLTSPFQPPEPPKPTFNRYYHLFRQYELTTLCASAAVQLGLSFSCPEGYPLEPPTAEEEGGANVKFEARDGYEPYLRVKEERWERENWVVELGVGWRREQQ